MSRPPHHRPGGGFRGPWERPGEAPSGLDVARFMWEQVTGSHPPSPDADQVPREAPQLAPPGPGPHADEAPGEQEPGELRATWLGHATFLLQWGRLNVLTDPHLSARASPVSWAGPKRFSPPGLTVEELPEIHAVVLSHDHYDHLDRPTVRALHRRFGDRLTWITPLAYREWFTAQGVERVVELDWEERFELEGDARAQGGAPAGGRPPISARLAVTCLPAQHWTRRGRNINERLWASFALEFSRVRDPGEPRAHHRLYFAGDSGHFPGYREIGARNGPFHTLLLPIGAYEPRWFMKYSHMNPEDAVQAYLDLGGTGHCIGMHWGTFRLTFEDPLEPPARMEAAWREAALDPGLLHLPGIGGTVRVEAE